jgi:hypothetical protein
MIDPSVAPKAASQLVVDDPEAVQCEIQIARNEATSAVSTSGSLADLTAVA